MEVSRGEISYLLVFASDQIVRFIDLPDIVRASLPPDELDKLDSVSWYTTTVKLDMEARGLIERIPGSRPQALRIVNQTEVP